jgi:hypothetical protein
MDQVAHGSKTAGTWLLGVIWLAIVFAGVAIAFTPSKFPPAVGWCLLAVAALVLLATANRWVTALPGILGVATLNSLAMIFTGHATGNPSVLVSRRLALFSAICLGASTLISLNFQDRNLHVHDRIAFLVYAICLAWTAIKPWTSYRALGTATAVLFAAWSYNHLIRTKSKG